MHVGFQLLNSIGGVALVMGMGAIAVAHCAVAPELRRSVDVARQAVNDGAAAPVVLSHTVEGTEALVPPTEAVTRRSVGMLKPAIALLDGLAETLRLIPGAGGVPGGEAAESSRSAPPAAGLPSLAKLGRAVDTLADEARALRTAALALEAKTRRHPKPSLKPVVAAAAARIRETQNIMAETNPALGMTLLADFIAGIYLVLGGALIALGRAVSR